MTPQEEQLLLGIIPQVKDMHEILTGNGHPEKSICWRTAQNETAIKELKEKPDKIIKEVRAWIATIGVIVGVVFTFSQLNNRSIMREMISLRNSVNKTDVDVNSSKHIPYRKP